MHKTRRLVQVFDGLCHLENDMATQILAKVGQPHDLVEEFPPGTQLEDDIVVLACFGEINQFDDVGVFNLPHDLDLFEDIGTLRQLALFPSPKANTHT